MKKNVSYHKEQESFENLIKLRFPEGMVCERCGGQKFWEKPVKRITVCKHCRTENSPLANTMLHRSHISLEHWSGIVRLMINSSDRVITARTIFREIPLGSYRSAWNALRKIRYAISYHTEDERLEGEVEFDEIIKRGQGEDYRKVSILGALEMSGEKRLSLKMVKNPDEMNIKDYFKKNFDKKAVFIVDPQKLYLRNWLELNRFKQKSSITAYGGKFMNIHVVLQDVKYGLRNGHHNVSEQFLQEYLDEYQFIFNYNDNREKAQQLVLGFMMNTPIEGFNKRPETKKNFLSIFSTK